MIRGLSGWIMTIYEAYKHRNFQRSNAKPVGRLDKQVLIDPFAFSYLRTSIVSGRVADSVAGLGHLTYTSGPKIG